LLGLQPNRDKLHSKKIRTSGYAVVVQEKGGLDGLGGRQWHRAVEVSANTIFRGLTEAGSLAHGWEKGQG